MRQTVFMVILVFGRFFLCTWGNCAYRLFENKLPWAEAQSYCRAKHLDLATVDNEEQLSTLIKATQRSPPLGPIWTGLYDDVNSWRWSLQEEGYYDGGLDQFRLWTQGQPINNKNMMNCGVMLVDGTWKSGYYTTERPFFCYSGATPHFIYVSKLMTWWGAQSYCRQYYTDLASVRNQAENDQLKAMMRGMFTYIGLYRDSWKWSDGSPVLFKKFNSEITAGLPCVALDGSGMVTEDCSKPYPFVCNDYSYRQVVKFQVTKKSSLNFEAVTNAMLKQFRMRLKDNGVDGNLRLTWKNQTDEKIFLPFKALFADNNATCMNMQQIKL